VIDLSLFLKSVALGLAIAAPLGPIGVLCINRTLERGFWAGMAGGLGTALADASYATLAAAGFAAFSATLQLVDLPLKLVGGLFMLFLGMRGLMASPARKAAVVGVHDLVGTISATFFLTIANPATILSFAAIFAGLGLGGQPGMTGAAQVVSGVFAGSLLWWFFLSGLVAGLHHRLPSGFSRATSILSGVMLMAFGLVAIGSLAMGLLARP
jgi:putative LysE/RhtB family amino acid efflux pump